MPQMPAIAAEKQRAYRARKKSKKPIDVALVSCYIGCIETQAQEPTMPAFNILSKAIRSLATESGFEVEIKDGFVALKDTNFGIAWISGYDFEVITNYSRSASWEHLKENPVSGDYKTCTLAAIRKAQYWKSKIA